ncbi:hypothetical protein ACU686_19840 [Yinghuangia aomiensis]
MALSKSGTAQAVQSSERVSTLELFFDLVFVLQRHAVVRRGLPRSRPDRHSPAW